MTTARDTSGNQTVTGHKLLLACAAMLLALTGCKENRLIDPNNAPEAKAEVRGHADDLFEGVYEIVLSGDAVELVLDAGGSEDGDGRIVEYIWMSGTRYPDGSPGRFIPENERLTDEQKEDGDFDAWPEDGVTTKVTLKEQHWIFHVYARDDDGAISAPATLNVTVGEPPPIPTDDEPMTTGMDDDAGMVVVTSVAAVRNMCGDNECATPDLGDICCTAPGAGEEGSALEVYGRTDGLCGADITIVATLAGLCLQVNQPGTLTADCADIDPGFGVEAGCCTDEGFCGSMNTTVPLGCHYPTTGKGEACEP